ncbi:MAG: hypothetical protein GTO24_21230 [candidate division Zixibacteria bacterium]|nr:hypothetical protein [candidate division Zixibacteria bacterium]
MLDRISLSYWFPILEKTGVRVPETQWWETEADFWSILDGEMDQSCTDFYDDLKRRANEWGYPLFLRTGHTSAKHSWKDSCYITKEGDIGKAVYGLIEFSAIAIPSLPLNIWAIREFLELDVHFHAFWGEMPIATERRYFIEGGNVVCSHPYWPMAALERTRQKPKNWLSLLSGMNSVEAPPGVEVDSRKISHQFEGAWSLDWARHKNGSWYAIDMAPADVSYHWPGCDNEKRWNRSSL